MVKCQAEKTRSALKSHEHVSITSLCNAHKGRFRKRKLRQAMNTFPHDTAYLVLSICCEQTNDDEYVITTCSYFQTFNVLPVN